MSRFRRLAMILAVALLAFVDIGRAQSFSARKPGLRTPPRRQAPQTTACGPTSITESSTNTVTSGNSVSCNSGGFHTDNHYWRAFDLTGLGIGSDFHVCEVTIGVEAASSVAGTQPITVNLYTSNPAFPAGVLTSIGTLATNVVDQSLSLVTFPVTGTAPAGSQLVVEIFTPSGIADGNSFFIGSNADPETAPSYISAADCGFPDPTTTADAGFPNMHIVMTVNGTASGPAALSVDPSPPADTGNGNGVLEIGESVVIAPSWTNGGATDFSLTGVASNLTGPFGPFYTINDSAADYGIIAAGTTGKCSDCYLIEIMGARPVHHFDAHFDETVTPSPLTLATSVTDTLLKTWILHVGNSFSDVDIDIVADPYYPSIETIFHFGVTVGCGDGSTYCPLQNNLRQEMAPFLLKALLGSQYTPPACTGVFSDVPCPATPAFPYSDFIEDLSTRGITGGCSSDPGPPPTIQYCPGRDILRSEMAVFLIKTSQGSGYVPPACTGVFSDVPCPATPAFPFSDFIEDIYARGITAGCGSDPGPPPTIQFCPDNPVTRQEMAVFLTLTFGLKLYGP